MPPNGGSYVTYFRASTDANLFTDTGTFYAIEINNVTWAGSSCSAQMHVKKRQSGVLTHLQSLGIACSADFETCYCIRNDRIAAYRDGLLNFLYQPIDASLPSGLPGVGVSSVPARNGTASAELYAIDTVAPTTPVLGPITTFHNKVELQWTPSVDSGVGFMVYQPFSGGSKENMPTVFIARTARGVDVRANIALVRQKQDQFWASAQKAPQMNKVRSTLHY